jgi:hypothetical protein
MGLAVQVTAPEQNVETFIAVVENRVLERDTLEGASS